MKLRVGMYIRTDLGEIGKITSIASDNVFGNGEMTFYNSEPFLRGKEIKASFNIIDILEEGDYVNGYYVFKIWEKDEITHYVDETPIKREEREIVIQAPSYGGIEILKNKNIKSILTKEQFEQMSYKVGD